MVLNLAYARYRDRFALLPDEFEEWNLTRAIVKHTFRLKNVDGQVSVSQVLEQVCWLIVESNVFDAVFIFEVFDYFLVVTAIAPTV